MCIQFHKPATQSLAKPFVFFIFGNLFDLQEVAVKHKIRDKA